MKYAGSSLFFHFLSNNSDASGAFPSRGKVGMKARTLRAVCAALATTPTPDLNLPPAKEGASQYLAEQ